MRIPALLAVFVIAYACAGPSQTPAEQPGANPVTLTLADLTEISDDEYPIEDIEAERAAMFGSKITVVFTNFCEQPTEFGFTPDEGKPPIVWTIQPRQRQRITVQRNYSLRARVAGAEYSDASCLAGKNGHHLTFNVDCETCTAGKDDPLERDSCIAAGTCVASDAPEPSAEPSDESPQ
jgi:hypothetical protein